MDNRVVYGVITILLNHLGVPCFMQGKTKQGVIRIILGVVTCGVIATINEIMGIIQGIKILCMSDEDYVEIKSGLSEGDTVSYISRTITTTSGGFDMMMPGGMRFPF